MTRSVEESDAVRVEIERESRQSWAYEVRINGRTYARCRSEDDARTVADGLRAARDAKSDRNRLSRMLAELRRLAEFT